ncbi:MAG: diguanylate cyclase [Bdellovibrionales bacterium]|jgi:diguanylate cyclase (GGDEF)-like protein|nr:diguanylate cyclase [Bdellovibrionales bacterium]
MSDTSKSKPEREPENGSEASLPMRRRRRLVMMVDDDRDNLNLVSALLAHEGYDTVQAESAEEALERLKTVEPHLILLDINMPGLSGLDLLKMLRARENYVSVIFVSARSETDDVVRGLNEGADDYICKPFEPTELLARVRAQLRIKDLQDRLAEANHKLQELIDIDDLTGLFNMRSIYDRLENEINRGKRYSRSVGVIMMDMDNFKRVNDTNDHLFGSYVLAEVGKIIRQNVRTVDFAARYGGDEFLITLPETSLEGAQKFADRIREKIENYNFTKDGKSMRLTASLGVCVAMPGLVEVDARGLVRAADTALYDAKHSGKNCVRTYDPSRFFLKKTS